jgi:hypothetical protein
MAWKLSKEKESEMDKVPQTKCNYNNKKIPKTLLLKGIPERVNKLHKKK